MVSLFCICTAFIKFISVAPTATNVLCCFTLSFYRFVNLFRVRIFDWKTGPVIVYSM